MDENKTEIASNLWRYDERNGFIFNSEGNIVAQTWNKEEEDFDQAMEHGHAIVQAVNCHQELLDACKGLIRIIEDLAVGGNKAGWKDMAIATLEAAKATINRAESGG